MRIVRKMYIMVFCVSTKSIELLNIFINFYIAPFIFDDIYLFVIKGHYDWINNIIDSGAAHHAEKWGCIWNKDIEGIVEAAGLKVTSNHRVHFGTTYIIEAIPK